MANILGLALKVTGDASGLAKSLTPVDRALDNLAKQADKATSVFSPFAEKTAAAGRAQEDFAARLANLAQQLRANVIGPQEYAAAFGQLTEEAKQAAQQFERGLELTQRYTTADEDRASQLREIADLVEKGAISEQIAARARADISGENARVAETEKARLAELNRLQSEASAITEKYRTDAERRVQIIEKLDAAIEAGRITEETYKRAIDDVTGATAEAAKAAQNRDALLAEGQRLTEANRTAEEKRVSALQRLDELYASGAIDLRTYNAEAMKATGVNDQIAKSEAERAEMGRRAAAIIEANMTTMERAERDFAAGAAEANRLREAGLLSDQEHARQVQKLADAYAKATIQANKLGNETENAAKQGLKFNEISGILSALPGPIGNIAGRLSGLASAGEGLGRIFSGGFSAGLATLGTSLSALINPFTAVIAGFAALGAAASAVVGGLMTLEKETEQLQNAADKLGVSFGFMQTLKQAAEMTGVSFETVNLAMTKLLKTLAGADEESKQATAALGRLGVSLQDLDGKSSEEQLRLIGERLTAIEDPAKRAAAATAIFGKSGAEILPFLNNLEVAEQTLTRFNARLSEIDVVRVLSLGDSFDAVKASLSGFGNELLTPFIGITQSISDGLASAIATFGRNVGAVLDIFSPLTSAIGLAINIFTQFGSILGNIVGTVFEPFAAAGRTVASVFDGVSRAVTSVAGRINDTVIGFREFFKFDGLSKSFSQAFAQVGETVSRVATIVARFAEVTAEAIGRVAAIVGKGVSTFLEFTGLGSLIATVTSAIGSAFGTLWDTIRGVISQVGGFIEQVLKFAEDWLGIVPEIERPVVATVELNDDGAIQELLRESKDFQKTLDTITGSVDTAITESAKFGQAGFDAALKYQTAIEELKAKLDAGLFNEETFRREADKAGAAFKSELARIEEDAQLDVQIKADAEKTLAGITQQIGKAVEQAAEFGVAGQQAAVAFQNRLQDLGRQFEAGILNQTALDAEIAKATAEYDKQIDAMKQMQQLQEELLKADKDRVDQLLAQSNTQTQNEKDIETVLREQARLEEEIRRQREAGNAFAADAAAARLAQLDQLRARLEDQQQAVEQGFADGFTKAFDATNKSIDGLIGKAEQFGSVGAMAAEALRQGIASAQQQASDGILTKDTYEREVARQQELFNQRLAAAQRVEEFLRQQLDERQRAELDAVKALEDRKKQAEVNIQAIKAKIVEQEQALAKAREEGDLKAAKTAKARIDQLNQAQRGEQALLNGQQGAARVQAQVVSDSAARAQQFEKLIAQQNTSFANAVQGSVNAANAAISKVAEINNKQTAFLRQLNTLGPQAVQTADIRTQQGAALVIGLAAEAQDPALVEARLQTKALKAIRDAIAEGTDNAPVPVRI